MKIDAIDTRHGTFNKPDFSNGNTLPYTGVPFGMNYFCLQNQNDTNWYFDPTYPIVQGIRMTHQPSPWMGDYSWLLVSPLTGTPQSPDLNVLQTSYKVAESVFKPYMMVYESLRYRLKSTIVPTKRGAAFSLLNRSNHSLGFVLTTEKDSHFKWNAKNKQLRVKITQPVNDNNNKLKQFIIFDFNGDYIADIDLNKREKDEWVKCSEVKSQSVWLSIQTECDNVAFTMGTSFISEKQAEINLSRELDNKSVNELARSSASEWETLLNKIEVSDSDKNKVNLFYQYMYRLFLFPQTYFEEDSNGEPIHYDSYSETVKAGKYFTNNGFWDTYRTVYPLFSLILPEKYQDILEGIGHFYNETGHLPKWLSPDERGLMPGTLINAVLADASLKDIISDNESEFFLNAMIKEATVPSDDERFGRAGLEDMQDLGYVANDKIESVNQTLDNAYSDFCIRQIAKKLNKKEIEQEYTKKALNYQRLFDKETGFMRGKNAEGDFSEQFVPEDWGYDYTEGSAWQNALAFYHDNQGYAELLGGESPFLNHLVELANSDPFFEIGNYGKEIHEMSESAVGGFGQIAISNQPSFHIPYLYAYAKKPEYTQHIVKQLCSHAFSNDFSGFPGDEDNGSMSGWAIFSMIGFYPVCPGTNEYVLGIPQFDKIVLHLKDNKSFEINVMDNVPYFSYVKSIDLNGQLYSPLYLMHDDIVQGGEMAIELSMLPSNKIFKDTDLPYSLTNELRD